jgi:cupin 2 domain-containing protein
MPHSFGPEQKGNIFAKISARSAQEQIQRLLETGHVRLERIVSHGHASPDGFWYDQKEHEWVVVLSGAARLRLEGAREAVEMGPGDFIHLPAHRRHRVEWTSPDEPTVWLAVFYGGS